MLRRNLLVGASALVPLAILGACATKSTDQIKADVELIANGLSNIIPTLRNLPENLRPPGAGDLLDKAQAAIDDIKANAQSVASSLTSNADIVQAISNDVSTLSALLSPFFPQAPLVATAVQAALALVSVLLASVGKTVSAAMAHPTMSPDDARAELRRAAAHR